MSDIVERLRLISHGLDGSCKEAADEIERLRHEINNLDNRAVQKDDEIERLRASNAQLLAALREIVDPLSALRHSHQEGRRSYQVTYTLETDDKWKEAMALLTDAMVMLSDIKAARALPAFAEVQDQYIALGRKIEEFLLSEGVIHSDVHPRD